MLGVAFFGACSETKEVSPEQLGSAYFPLEVGQYSIFDVSRVEYFPSGDSTVSNYQLKESISGEFENLETGTSYIVLRALQTPSAEDWVTDSVWTARKDEFRAIRVENNIPLIRLTFPVKENKKWDANGLNDLGADEYEMKGVGSEYSGAFQTFDQTVTIIQEDIPDKIVNFVSKKEIYAMEVGLVYKENIILKFKQGEFLGEEIIDSGFKYFQSLKEYGQE